MWQFRNDGRVPQELPTCIPETSLLFLRLFPNNLSYYAEDKINTKGNDVFVFLKIDLDFRLDFFARFEEFKGP